MEIDFATKKVTVTMASGKSLSKDTCDRAFEGSRYKVASFQAE